jgi:hypothetical protein
MQIQLPQISPIYHSVGNHPVSFDFRNLFKEIKASENFVLIALDYPILERMVALKEVPNCFNCKISQNYP